MDFGNVLSRAWQITWRWKALWILGFLASLGQGVGSSTGSYRLDASDLGRWTITEPSPGVIGLIVGIGCLAILIGIAVWVISVMARGGLIAGVQQVEDQGGTSFLQAWRVGRDRFWTLFGIGVLTTLPMIFFVLLGFAALGLTIFSAVRGFSFSEAQGGMGVAASVLCGAVFCCGAVIVGTILDLIRKYAERAAILEGRGWTDAFGRGWQVLKENIGPTLVLWLIFLAVGIVIGGIIFGAVVALAIPFISVASNLDPSPWLVLPICGSGLVAIIAGALIGSVVETFTSATWTLAYREMTGMSAAATAVEPSLEL